MTRAGLLGLALLAGGARAESGAPQAPDPALLRELMGQLAPHAEPLDLLKREAAQLMACMQEVDQEELALVQARVEREAQSVRQLCAANRRDEAQRVAQRSAAELLATPVVDALQQCDPMLGDLGALLPWLGSSARFNVCDLDQTAIPPAKAP